MNPKAPSRQSRRLIGCSHEVLRQLGPDIQRLKSYVAADKTFRVCLVKDESVITKHAELSGFVASKITEIRKMSDPTTERAGANNKDRSASVGLSRASKRHTGIFSDSREVMTPVLRPMVRRPPKKRACSILQQRSMTTSRPPSRAILAPSSLITPS